MSPLEGDLRYFQLLIIKATGVRFISNIPQVSAVFYQRLLSLATEVYRLPPFVIVKGYVILTIIQFWFPGID